VRHLTANRVLAIVGFLVTALLGPFVLNRVTQVNSDREKETDIRIGLISRVDQAVTSTVVKAQLFASGLLHPGDAIPVSEPPASNGTPVATGNVSSAQTGTLTAATAYADTLSGWLDESSQLGDELQTYFGDAACPEKAPLTPLSRDDRVRCDWIYLFSAVTDYLRLAAHVEPLDAAIATDNIKRVLTADLPAGKTALNFSDLTPPASGKLPGSNFYPAVQQVEQLLLLARDGFIRDLRQSRAGGFSTHFW